MPFKFTCVEVALTIFVCLMVTNCTGQRSFSPSLLLTAKAYKKRIRKRRWALRLLCLEVKNFGRSTSTTLLLTSLFRKADKNCYIINTESGQLCLQQLRLQAGLYTDKFDNLVNVRANLPGVMKLTDTKITVRWVTRRYYNRPAYYMGFNSIYNVSVWRPFSHVDVVACYALEV